MVISHIRKDAAGEWVLQSNEEHQKSVAELVEKFASEFGMSDIGRVMGLLHDKGKEQEYIHE